MPAGSATAARPGLCSVTYRQMAPRDVVACAADAGLAVVEWGGDRHVPPGDVGTAAEVRALTVEAGLSTSSYGSYFRAGVTDFGEWPAVVRTAVALGAPRVRVWAGVVGSAGAGGEQRDAVVRALREAGRIAADHGVVVATEFHAGTLADSAAATIGLLDEVARPDVRTYWQPPEGMPDAEAVAGLRELGDRVCALHVFSWWPGNHRLRLPARSALWHEVFDVVRSQGRVLDSLLEFVPQDRPDLLREEAAALVAMSALTEEVP